MALRIKKVTKIKANAPFYMDYIRIVKKKSSSAAKKAGSTTKSQNKSLFLAYGSPASSQATSISAVDPGESIDEAPRRPLSEKTNLHSASMSSRSANSFLQL